MPDVDVETLNGLAGVDVDVLDVEVEVYACLVLFDVGADELTEDVVWAGGDLGGEDAGCVRGEYGGGVSVERVVEGIGHVAGCVSWDYAKGW